MSLSNVGTDANYDANDPFAPPPPSWSWSGGEVGDKLECEIVKPPTLIRQLDGNRRPESWDGGEPKMTAVTVVKTDEGTFSLWAAKPSSLFAAMVEASKQAGESMRTGGTLEVEIIEIVPSKRKNRDDKREFSAEYVPPTS